MRWMMAVTVVLGCNGKDPTGETPTTTTTSTTLTTSLAGPAYYGDVEPILRSSCVGCHQSGGIGPMGLDTLEAVVPWADALADSVADRRMPPWLATDDGSCGDFANSRWLDQVDIDTIVAWAADGAPAGDPALAVSDPLPEPPRLSRTDLTVSTPTFVPEAEGTDFARYDEYRCFLIEDPTDEDLFLTGFEVLPGNAAIVHHVLLMPVAPGAPGWDGTQNRVLLDQMNGADGREGWDCFGAAGGNVREKGVPVVWAPGMGAVEYPSGAGVSITAQDLFVVQVHYNLVDPQTVGSSDSTSIALKFELPHTGVREAYLSLPDAFLGSLFEGQPDMIPPGESEYAYTFTLSGAEALAAAGAPQSTWNRPSELISVMPHMHGLGKRQSLRVIPASGPDVCALDVQEWNFEWQLNYFYETPLTLQPDDTLEVTCVWDSSALTEPTLPGWGTNNEMCLVTMMLVPQ